MSTQVSEGIASIQVEIGAPSAPTRSRLAFDAATAAALWRREMLHLRKEPARWLGIVLQPVMLWLILGSGMASSFRIPGAEQMGFYEYFFPGVLVMIALFTAIFGTIGVIEDRQSGFLQSVLVGPASRSAMVAGKALGVTSIVLTQTVIFLALAPLAGYPLARLNLPALALALALITIGLTAVGLTMAWRSRSVQGYHAVMSLVLVPLWMLSGAVFPAGDSWLGVLMRINPMTYAVAGVRAGMGGHDPALGLPGLGPSLMVLAVFCILAVVAAATLCRGDGARR